jgi:hypothetical protein
MAAAMSVTNNAQTPWRWLTLELGLGALALVLAGLLAPDLRPIARIAVGSSLLAGLISFAAIHAGYPKGINGLFAGMVGGFFARMILVAVGLVASGARGDAALAFALIFFAVFAVTQATEIAYVIARNKARPAAQSEVPASSLT